MPYSREIHEHVFTMDTPLRAIACAVVLLATQTFQVAACAGPDDEIKELIQSLEATPLDETWALCERLASFGERAVEPVLDAVADKRLEELKAVKVLKLLNMGEAQVHILSALSHADARRVLVAAQVFEANPSASAVEPLTLALHQTADLSGARALGAALKECADNETTTKAFLAAARRLHLFAVSGEILDSCWLLDTPLGRSQLTKEERLRFLLDYKIPMRTSRTDAAFISLPSQHEDRKLLPDDDDEKFVQQYRDDVVEIMLSRLQKSGDLGAALLLGHLRERRAVPFLRECFLTKGRFYGWEGMSGDCFASNQYCETSCYEEALCYITGLPLEKAIGVTKKEIQALMGRAMRNGMEGSEDPAIYLLYRLAPGRALEEMARRFRRSPHSANVARMLAEYLLKPGIRMGKIRKLLGEPDRVDGSVWLYSCKEEPSLHEEDRRLQLSLNSQNGALKSAECIGGVICQSDILLRITRGAWDVSYGYNSAQPWFESQLLMSSPPSPPQGNWSGVLFLPHEKMYRGKSGGQG